MTKKNKHATLSEVAKKAGVGTTTVSRVINGGQSVDPKTLARVQRAIESLGYMPNQAARILKGDRTRTIGFVIPSIADPFFSSCAEAAEAIARANDSLLIVLTTQNDSKAELDAVNVLVRHRVDGFMIAPSDSRGGLLSKLISRLSMPIVAFDRPFAELPIPSVVADNFTGAQIATRHLIEHGYKRIMCLTGEVDLFTIQERIRGYQQAMKAAGLECVVDTSVRDHQSTEQALDKMLRSSAPPEAIFTLKNSTTIDTLEVLQEHNVAIPRSVALLGYDDFQLAETVRPSISVIRQPIDEIGHVAAELLFERLFAPSNGALARSARTRQVKLKTQLILRASCGCLRERL
jgi:LacI family transcriptional regulator, galactose operon repressor